MFKVVSLLARARLTGSLRSHTFRPSITLLLTLFVVTVLWYPKPSAEDRRSEIKLAETKLVGTREVRITEAWSVTTATRLVQHSEHEIRVQASRTGPVFRHLTTVKKLLEIQFAIAMLNAGGRGVLFLLLTGVGAGCLRDRCSGTSGRI